MAWNVAITRDGRQRLVGVLRVLLIAQLIISLAMAIYCYNTSVRVMSLLKHIHKVTVFLLYGLILLQAYCMKLHYTSGFRLLTWLLRYPHWSRAIPVTKLWLITGSLVAVNGLLVHAACKSTLKALQKELSSSLKIGISHYLSEPSWKILLDTMQVELSCCGAEQPSDWHEIPWLNVDFLKEDSDLVTKLAEADGTVLVPVSPYSCCTPHVLAACYHDPLQQWEWQSGWALGGASRHTRGCVEAVRTPLTRATLALQLFGLLVLLLQVVIVAATQMVRYGCTHARQQVHASPAPPTRSGSELQVCTCAHSRRRRRVRTRSLACLS